MTAIAGQPVGIGVGPEAPDGRFRGDVFGCSRAQARTHEPSDRADVRWGGACGGAQAARSAPPGERQDSRWWEVPWGWPGKARRARNGCDRLPIAVGPMNGKTRTLAMQSGIGRVNRQSSHGTRGLVGRHPQPRGFMRHLPIPARSRSRLPGLGSAPWARGRSLPALPAAARTPALSLAPPAAPPPIAKLRARARTSPRERFSGDCLLGERPAAVRWRSIGR